MPVPGEDSCILFKGELSSNTERREIVSSGADQLGPLDLEVVGNVVNKLLIRNGKSVFPVGHSAAHQAEDFIQRSFTLMAGLP